MKVAAVIPHWNRAAMLRTLLENLKQQTRPFDEVVVVDNGSTDGSVEVAEEAGARVVRLDRNYGFAVAVNRGIAATNADWVAILNNDVTLDPSWLERLLNVSVNVSFATGKILSARDRSILDGTWDAISRAACPVRIGSGTPDSAVWDNSRIIHIASMTACLFRRELFSQVGPLDERFGSYLEDVDFGLRCAKGGFGGVYEPSATAYHQGSSTLGRWNPDTVQLLSRNQVLLACKHFGGQPRWPILAGQLLWGLVALRHGCGLAWLRGKLAGLSLKVENDTKDAPEFTTLLRESEADIFAHHHELYWRLYSWLVR